MSINILPRNDIKEHVEDITCACGPEVIIENGEMIIIHNSYDRREVMEFVNEVLDDNKHGE